MSRRLPSVVLVGRPNVGKSTLFNRLTGADVFAKNLLFATLDPTMRRVELPSGRTIILSDTVGFVSDLPHDLVAAFRATLEEVLEADIVLHVRDIAHPETEAQREDVLKVLAELGLSERQQENTIEVLNKLDMLEPEEKVRIERLAAADTGLAAVSAWTGEGVEGLRETIARLIDDDPETRVTLAPDQGEALAWLYEHGRVTDRETDELGRTRVTVRLHAAALGRFERLYPDLAG